jgi:hypothetical protein
MKLERRPSMTPIELSPEQFEEASKRCFAEAMLCYGVVPRGEHSWENQTPDCRASWFSVVTAVVQYLNEIGENSAGQ